ncbi:MAG: hypothetical protein JXB88_09645 [Spirochaetales bacterium]|nr:hypothetical protein [Spirochaetales bacterium]
MKFKSIFIVFNIVIAFSFLFFFLMPVFIFGLDNLFLVFSKYWIALSLFLVLLIVFNVYFIINWKFFRLLENEDWYGLINYLENRIYHRRIISKRSIKILLNTYLCTSNSEGIKKLAGFLKKQKPFLVSFYSLRFSIPYLIADTPEESELFFKYLLQDQKLKHRDWITWDYGIILMQQKKRDEAITTFSSLLFPNVDAIIYLLALYMLNSLCNDNKRLKNTLDLAKEEYGKNHTRNELTERIEKNKNNIQILSLRSTILEAFKWMFPETDKNPGEKKIALQEN